MVGVTDSVYVRTLEGKHKVLGVKCYVHGRAQENNKLGARCATCYMSAHTLGGGNALGARC